MTPDAFAKLLRTAKTVVVLGCHVDPSRPANYVPAYLHARGLTIIPVNARLAGQSVFGRTILASLAEVTESADILDVFRRSEDVAAHCEEILAMQQLPKCVWLQSGIRDDASAAVWEQAGIAVVQDHCLMVEHRRFA